MGVNLRDKTESNNDFQYDLKIGQLGESLLSKVLSFKKVEVKRDLYASMTGNICVEYESRGKKSGIATTTAEYWAFIIAEDKFILLIETDKLKDIARRKYKAGSVKNGGDNMSSKLIIIPVAELLELINEVTLY